MDMDETDLIGGTLAAAQNMAAQFGYTCRACSYNGQAITQPSNIFDANRVNLHLVNDQVVAVDGWG